MNKAFPAVSALIVTLFGMSLLWIASAWGNGASPDSMSYFLIARDINSFDSLLRSTSQWPPMYPLLIKAASLAANDLVLGVRLLHCLLFGLNIWLFFFLVSERLEASDSLSLLATLLFALTPSIFHVNFMAWSESPFLTFMLLFLIYFQDGLTSKSVTSLLIASLALSLALLTRYVGLAIIAGAWLILICEKDNWPSRIVRSSYVAIIAITPLTTFLIMRSILIADTSLPRNLVVHWIDLERASNVLPVVGAWFSSPIVPIQITTLFLGLGLVTIIVGLTLGGRATVNFGRSIIVVMASYIIFLFLSISLFDFYTPIDNRTLFPLFPLLLAAFVFSARQLRKNWQPSGVLLSGIVLIMTLSSLPVTLYMASEYSRSGWGALSKNFRSLEILQYIASQDVPLIYSNAGEIIDFYIGKPNRSLPAIFNMADNHNSPSAAQDYLALATEVRSGEAIVVYFQELTWREQYPSLEFFEKDQALPILFKGNGGLIFGVRTDAAADVSAN